MEESIISCAVKASYEMDAKLIIVFTNQQSIASMIAKFRPACNIMLVSSNQKAVRQIMIIKGISHILVGSLIGSQALIEKSMD